VKPSAFVRGGYRKGVMPPFAPLAKKQLANLVAFPFGG